MRARTLAATVLIALGATTGAAAPGPGEVGSLAADFTLEALGGGTHTLSDYRGKVVMLFIVGYG